MSSPARLTGGGPDPVRNCKEDALAERPYEDLLAATYQIDDPDDALEARFIVIATGRLGLRAGELVHCREDWIDWSAQRIEIPRHQPCKTGRGPVCGLCKQNAEQEVDVHNGNVQERRDAIANPDHDARRADFEPFELEPVSLAERMEHRWLPKTEAAVRGVPFGWSARCERIVDRFFDRWRRFPHSYQTARRRLDAAAEIASSVAAEELYLHALRATSGSFHAGRGLGTLSLMSYHGWSQLSTAEAYVTGSDESTDRALRAVHSR